MTGNRKRTITCHVDYILSVNPGIAEYSLVAALHGFSCVHQAQKSIINLVQDTLELLVIFVCHGDVPSDEAFQLLHARRDAHGIVVDVDAYNDCRRLCDTAAVQHSRIDLEVLHSFVNSADSLGESPDLNGRDIFVLTDNIHGDVPFRIQVFRRSEEIVRDINKHCAVFLFVFSHLRNCGCSLTTQDEILSLLRWFLKRNKNSSCIRLPVKVHFRTRIYSTHQRKLPSFIPHLCKKVNRIYKNSLK